MEFAFILLFGSGTVFVAAMFFGLILRAARQDAERLGRECCKCAYPLRGLRGPNCPECGERVQ